MAEQCNTMNPTPDQQSNEQPMSAVDIALGIAETKPFSRERNDFITRFSLLDNDSFFEGHEDCEDASLRHLAAEVRRIRSALNMSEVALAATHELASKLREQTRWKPIETAPMDGTDFVIYVSDNDYIDVGCWAMQHGGFLTTDSVFVPKHRVSHWMPLPAMPESGEKGGAS